MVEEKSAWQIYKSKVLNPNYLWKKVALMILCRIHDFTRYKVCRSLTDLFYWPDGFCADTVVICLFFIFALWSMWDDIRIFISCTESCVKDVKYLFKMGLALINAEDDFEED